MSHEIFLFAEFKGTVLFKRNLSYIYSCLADILDGYSQAIMDINSKVNGSIYTLK